MLVSRTQEVGMGATTNTPKGKRKHQPGRKADYQEATPEQVAEAILRYRPDKGTKAKPSPKR